jgi:NtrC-family two-component system response regulator AlgB
MERAVILWPHPQLGPEALPDAIAAHVTHAVRLGGDHPLELIEREHIERVLARVATQDEAARILGIDASTLWRKKKRYEGA